MDSGDGERFVKSDFPKQIRAVDVVYSLVVKERAKSLNGAHISVGRGVLRLVPVGNVFFVRARLARSEDESERDIHVVQALLDVLELLRSVLKP